MKPCDPKVSGTREQPITFAAYKDEEVTISGTEPIEDWSSDRLKRRRNGDRQSIFRAGRIFTCR